MEYQIHGSTMQTLEVRLSPGDRLFSETGCLLSMTPGTNMETHAPGGLGGMLRRAFSGNSIMLNYFEATHDVQTVRFTTRMPGHILAIPLRQYGRMIVQRHAFLCAEDSVDFGVEATLNIGRFLGGNGLVFTYLEGEGTGFISVDGEVVHQDLARGEGILVHPGHIAAFTGDVDYRVQRMQGVTNMFFGGDGLYLVRLTGPGRVWLHSVTIHNLAHVLGDYMRSGRE
ncbi:TIGR00266 family protein [Alicyclobacillus fastidiosus]|uniref:TIGR00266 family protein n=1 Tax=Alicyclobacillus fastidiosus TaxID=392011 RepID=A0ABY6ZM27_9BACL|nr:TIGR00266 family protein [Alicyclobacillus fastidiosus]WAH43899.1 TIGR00266 family protein [Alicyclobacillus fastidiosus]